VTLVRFQTSDRLIDLLVGQNLYSNADAALRELIQNGEDAGHLQRLVNPSFAVQISVRFSRAEGWVEVVDDGLGMDPETFEHSFATIGASKTNAPRIQALLATAGAGQPPQIGQFGIGILSCFGVADQIDVYTRSDGHPPVSVRIAGRHTDFMELNDHRADRGTTVRLKLKAGGPMNASHVPEAVKRYVRHANHVWLEDVDAGERQSVPAQWILPAWNNDSPFSSDIIESGHLQLSEGWTSIHQPLDVAFILCNGGFFVSGTVTGLLHPFAVGVRGELNIRPGALTILMNREAFQQDERWGRLAGELNEKYRQLLAPFLDRWLATDLNSLSSEERSAAQRAVLLINGPLRDAAGPDNSAKAAQLLPDLLLLEDGKAGRLHGILQVARAKPPLYAYRIGEQGQISRTVSDRGQSLQYTEPVRTTDLRASLLRLNGFAVVSVARHDYAVQPPQGAQAIQINELDVLTQYCSTQGIPVQQVNSAPAEHTDIGSSPDAESIARLLQLSSDLKIQSVNTMTDAIIADFQGYILNVDNPEVRRIMQAMPDALGNPIRRDLMLAYFALSTLDIGRARKLILDVVTDPEFDAKSSLTTGRYFRAFLEERVASLLKAKERRDV
jgi:histidine kinase/DNA gyrase B/HSP90-like ATPase